MTIIAAVRPGPGRIIIGSDEMATSADTCMYGVQKIITGTHGAIGVAGNVRTINLIDHHKATLLGEPRSIRDMTIALRTLLTEDGYTTESGAHDSSEWSVGPVSHGQQLMIYGNHDGLWSIAPDYSCVLKIPDNQIWADGGGRAYALGAARGFVEQMDVFKEREPGRHIPTLEKLPRILSPAEEVLSVIRTAIYLSDGCGSDPVVHDLTFPGNAQW